jgi:hypothetical protein
MARVIVDDADLLTRSFLLFFPRILLFGDMSLLNEFLYPYLYHLHTSTEPTTTKRTSSMGSVFHSFPRGYCILLYCIVLYSFINPQAQQRLTLYSHCRMGEKNKPQNILFPLISYLHSSERVIRVKRVTCDLRTANCQLRNSPFSFFFSSKVL